MQEWNAIDLHVHTISGITRDKTSDNVNFSYELFCKAIIEHNLKLIAITNHNIIDISNYLLCKFIAEIISCNVLMGVELDSSLTTGDPVHIAAIANDDFNSNFVLSKEINKTTTKKKEAALQEIIYDDNEIVDLINKYDLLLIPHGDKSRGVFKNATAGMIEDALKKIKEGFIRIFDSPSNWKLEKIKSYLKDIKESNLDDFGGVLFSDVRDWNNYDLQFRDFYMMAEPTFNGLLHSMTNPTKRFCIFKEINKNHNYISKIEIISNNERIESTTLNFSSGFNCIIGKSGSGKSLLLHLIKRNIGLDEQEKDMYSFANDVIFKIYNEFGEELNNANINITSGKNIYNQIITAISTNDFNDTYKIIEMISPNFIPKESFNCYIEKYKERIDFYLNLIENKSTLVKEINESMNEYNTLLKQLADMTNIKVFDFNPILKNREIYNEEATNEIKCGNSYISEIEKIIGLYKGKNKTNIKKSFLKFKEDFIFLLNYVDYQNAKLKYENILIDNINASISEVNKIKSKVSKLKGDLITKIPEIRSELVENIAKLYIIENQIESHDLSIDARLISHKSFLCSDNTVVVNEWFDDEKFKKVNIKDNIFFKTYNYKGKLPNESYYDLTDFCSSKKMIDTYIEVGMLDCNKKWEFDESFIPEVDVFFGETNVKEMNPGDIAKKYLEIYFKEQVMNTTNSVVLYDQIENDVDKPFIYEVIKKLIEDTKGFTQLIVVTHDPIVAVNSDPTSYIECSKNKNKIKYRSFVIESNVRDEIKTISDIVDGSKEVIRNRYEIYRGELTYED